MMPNKLDIKQLLLIVCLAVLAVLAITERYQDRQQPQPTPMFFMAVYKNR